jgi:hypothetical protein
VCDHFGGGGGERGLTILHVTILSTSYVHFFRVIFNYKQKSNIAREVFAIIHPSQAKMVQKFNTHFLNEAFFKLNLAVQLNFQLPIGIKTVSEK